VKPGEVVGFVGHNGAGKTTTIKMLMGFIEPTAGNISVFGESAKSVSVKRKIGFLPERPYFYSYLTGKELLSYFGKLSGIDRKVLPSLIETVLTKVGLTDAGNLKLASFSKGMLQRIGIAQAIIHDPDLVIMDEPMSGLDPAGRKEVKEIIRGLKKDGKTVLFSSHILSDIENLSDRVLIIEKGEIRSFGTLDEIFKSSETHYKIVFDVPEEEGETVFSHYVNLKKENNYYSLSFESEDSMNSSLKELLLRKYTIKSAGAVYPTLEEVVFNVKGE